MTKPLLIVESPNKAKTIAKYLGDGWAVAASYGHIRDLPQREMGLSAPNFVLDYDYTDKGKSVVAQLRKLAAEASHVYLATDPDREGEAISWHLKDTLKLSDANYSRVTYTVVDKASILAAIDKPRKLDMNLVHAQEARRALDRLVGFMVSPAISDSLGMALSAGRVQSVAVRLVVEQEAAIGKFKATQHFGAVVDFGGWKANWITKPHANEDGYVLDQALTAHAAACRAFKVVESAQTRVSEAPPAPFNTSSLLQAADVSLKFNPDKTMKVAQQLFEKHPGLISYHRTDSVNYDAATVAAIREVLEAEGLPAAPEHRRFKEKADAQLGHEAIRPADLSVREAGETEDERALYRLIWMRAVACQMADATYTETALQLQATDNPQGFRFSAKGRVPIDLGWRRLTAEDAAAEADEADDKDESGGQVPALQQGASAQAIGGKVLNKVTRPPTRYSLASLAKKLEGLGIGRPATYASILTNVLERGYIAEQARKLHATKVGIHLVDALLKLEFNFMAYDYTRELEKRLDDVAGGKATYVDVVRKEHGVLATDVAKAKESKAVTPLFPCPKCQRSLKRVRSKGGEYFWLCTGYPNDCQHTMDDKAGQPVERPSFPCPECQRPMYRRSGDKGYFWGCSGFKDGCNCTLPDDKGKPGKRAEVSEHPCPECGKGLIHRVKKARGKAKGFDFWGCSGYPSCDYSCKSGTNGKPLFGVKRAS